MIPTMKRTSYGKMLESPMTGSSDLVIQITGGAHQFMARKALVALAANFIMILERIVVVCRITAPPTAKTEWSQGSNATDM
tara:strand:+ start:57 stop:299 length:243 start_codon:yes stop_codon:yes gene_type:complete